MRNQLFLHLKRKNAKPDRERWGMTYSADGTSRKYINSIWIYWIFDSNRENQLPKFTVYTYIIIIIIHRRSELMLALTISSRKNEQSSYRHRAQCCVWIWIAGAPVKTIKKMQRLISSDNAFQRRATNNNENENIEKKRCIVGKCYY